MEKLTIVCKLCGYETHVGIKPVDHETINGWNLLNSENWMVVNSRNLCPCCIKTIKEVLDREAIKILKEALKEENNDKINDENTG